MLRGAGQWEREAGQVRQQTVLVAVENRGRKGVRPVVSVWSQKGSRGIRVFLKVCSQTSITQRLVRNTHTPSPAQTYGIRKSGCGRLAPAAYANGPASDCDAL